MLNGILLVDKKRGTRSTACLNSIKRSLEKKQKAGHAGTLDSTAEGLLVVLLGVATRASSYIMTLPKTYEVLIRFGKRTDTDDYEGDTLDEHPTDDLYLDKVRERLFSFSGRRMQYPPKISAVRLEGARSHDLARKGINVETASRPVTITSIRISSEFIDNGSIAMRIKCHKGTYIRSFARELGEAMGCGAHVAFLRRTAIGHFSLDDRYCISVGSDTPSTENIISSVKPISSVIKGFTSYRLTADQELSVKNGKKLPLDRLNRTGFGIVPSSDGIVLEGKGLISFASLTVGSEKNTLYLHPDTNLFLPE